MLIAAGSIARPRRMRERGSASRPKPAKLVVNGRLRELVQQDLARKYSPEQIAGRLRLHFPDDL